MRTDNNYQSYENAGTNEEIIIDDLAPPLTIDKAARLTKKFIKTLPNDITDIELGSGL